MGRVGRLDEIRDQPRRWEGYATAELDTFRKELRDTFLGVRPPPLTLDEVALVWLVGHEPDGAPGAADW